MFWKIVTFLSFLLAFIALIIAIVSEDKAKQNAAFSSSLLLGEKYPTSCKSVKGSKNGLYRIQPNSETLPFYTYCDMMSVGGGWTLVASIHENNINGKCTVGDKWSSEQENSNGYLGSGNWENKNIFGRADTITTDDFKNAAYYSTEATDVMIWHVPNNIRVSDLSERAFFKYYTYNKFLSKYGSTLQSLYANHVQMRVAEGGIKYLLRLLNQTNIVSGIDNWNNYRYDVRRNPTRISDGGNDMYDGGNRVYFRNDISNFTSLVYGGTYFLFGQGIEVSSAQIYPFIALSWVGNMSRSSDYFELKIVSNYGADGNGNYSTYSAQPINVGTTKAMYQAFNVYNASDPSVCEVFFFIGDEKWNSIVPSKMEAISWSNTTQRANNIIRYQGPMKNVFLGYTLLSRKKGQRVTQLQVESVIKKLMKSAVEFEFDYSHKQVITPVKFLRGNASKLQSGVPILQQNLTQAGYIQFRAFNTAGFPNALCPGIKTTSNSPEQFCVGGINTAPRFLDQCGDFSGWAGVSGETKSENFPSATGRSLKDIDSTILIFTK